MLPVALGLLWLAAVLFVRRCVRAAEPGAGWVPKVGPRFDEDDWRWAVGRCREEG